MDRETEELQRIKDTLSGAPHGMSITELARDLGLHRTTIAKYLDSLQMRGEVDLRIMGTSKIYHPVVRIPSSSLPLLHSGQILFFSSRLTVRRFIGDFKTLLDGDDLTGKEIGDPLFRPIMQDDIAVYCRKAITGTPHETRIIITVRGQKKHIHIRIVPVVYEDGRPGSALILTDETICRNAIEKAGIYADEISAISAEQSEFIFRARTDGTLTWMNDAFCRRLERNREDLLGFPYEPVVSHDDLQQLEEAKSRITPDNPSVMVSFKAIQPDGMVSFEEWIYRGIFTGSGALDGYIGIGKDISRLHHLEEQLQTYHANFESLVKQRTREMRKANQDLMAEIARREKIERELLIIQFVFHNASDSIILFEQSGRVWRANETADHLLGYTTDEIRDLTVYDVNPEINQKIWDEMWQEENRAKESTRATSVHRRKDGTIIPVELSRKFISAGNITLFCSIARQIMDPK